jgi:hypothetical protein
MKSKNVSRPVEAQEISRTFESSSAEIVAP